MAEFTLNVKWEKFRDATHCHICERSFEIGDLRVRDHCHLTGRYRGPAHSRCNLHYQYTYIIPVRSILHEIYTESELMLALSPYDDKRYVIPESVATLGDIIKYLCNVRCIFLL